MIKVSELLGKPIIALASASLVGTAVDIIFDNKLGSAKWLKIHNELNDSDPETLFVEFKNIKNKSSDALTIDHKGFVVKTLELKSSLRISPINSLCYNQDGKLLGTVKDILLNDLSLEFFVVGESELAPSNLLASSNKLLIFNDTGRAIKLELPKKKVAPKPKKPAKAKIEVNLSEKSDLDNLVELGKTGELADIAKNPSQENLDITYPLRLPQEQILVSRSPASKDNVAIVYGFLLGKTLAKALYGDDKKLIARENSVITEETIMTAKNQSKLVQLALYAD